MRAMATLSAQLAESERTVRALERQLESNVLEKNQAINAQVYPLKLPAWLYALHYDQ